MSNTGTASALPHPQERPPSPQQTLRQLFLTLFLRGRSSRGLKKQSAPTSIGQKLGLTLGLYVLVGLMALSFVRQPVFALAAYLHAMTFVFLGMFVASSTGEILFNDQEADILLHRPISSRALLWAKVRVLIEVSLWLAGAVNLAGLFVGLAAPDGDWRFPLVHAASTVLEALCCTGCVVMVYQFCLRWFGRERLDGLMTAAQVIISIAAVLGGQLLPQLICRLGHFRRPLRSFRGNRHRPAFRASIKRRAEIVTAECAEAAAETAPPQQCRASHAVGPQQGQDDGRGSKEPQGKPDFVPKSGDAAPRHWPEPEWCF